MNRSRVTGDLASHGNIFVDIANDRVGIGSTIPGQKLSLPDSAKIALGNSADLFLEHDGNNSVFRNTTGDLYIQNNGSGTMFIQPVNNVGSITAVANGRVELAFAGTKKFETTTNGSTLFGTQQNLHGDIKFDNQTNSGMDLRWDESLNRLHFEQDNIKLSLIHISEPTRP